MHKCISIALAEVGYLEKKTPEQLDSKLSNPGEENYTKYARDMHACMGFYLGSKQGFPWCDVFVDWCFVQAYGAAAARRLLCQPLLSRGAGCRYSYGYYEECGQIVREPREGDQIFFRQGGGICHTGLVTRVEDGWVHTVEGNTSDQAGIIPNGGCVACKRYPADDPGIAGYGRPDYRLVGEAADASANCR